MAEDLVKYSDRGLEWNRKPENIEELKSIGKVLEYFTDNLPWAFADWYLTGETLFNQDMSQLLPDIGRSTKTLKNWVFVGSRIPFDERKYKLEFSHYSEVARLLREAREALLAKAEVEEWSVSRLRKEIKGEKPKKPKMITCPKCNFVFDINQKGEEN